MFPGSEWNWLSFCLSLEIPKVHIRGNRVISVFIGSQKSLFCQGYGHPMPSLKWSKVNGNISASATVFDDVINFVNISLEDAGVYRCIATNDIGSVLADVHMTVQGELRLCNKRWGLKINCRDINSTKTLSLKLRWR